MELPAAAAGDKNSDLRKKLEARKALNVATAGQGGTSQADGSGKNRKSGSGSGNRENGYARVDGPKISKVMQSVCLTLGRETQGAKRKAPEPPVDEQAAEEAQREKQREKTFLAIGQSASISRRHVEIVYDFRKRRWALLCLGRNGVFVDNVFVQQSDAAVPLHNKSRIEVPTAVPLVFSCPTAQAVNTAALQRPTESLKVLIAQVTVSLCGRSLSFDPRIHFVSLFTCVSLCC
jgi:hypothetical protein